MVVGLVCIIYFVFGLCELEIGLKTFKKKLPQSIYQKEEVMRVEHLLIKCEKEFLTLIVVMVLFSFVNFFVLAFGKFFYFMLLLAGITAFLWGDTVFGSLESFLNYVHSNREFVLFGVIVFLFFTDFYQALMGGYLLLCVFTGSIYKEVFTS